MTYLLSLERHNNITKLCVKVKYFNAFRFIFLTTQ